MTKIAVLKSCHSPVYGSICFPMVQEFINGDIKEFVIPEQGEENLPVKKLPEVPVKEFTYVEYDVEVEGKYPNLDTLSQNYDAIILPGSLAGANDAYEWVRQLEEYLRKVFEETDVPMFGICFGHQILCKALGGEVEKREKGFFGNSRTLKLDNNLKLEVPSVKFLHTHNDQVYKLPDDAICFTENSIPGENGYHGVLIRRNGKARVLSLQGHPEYLTPTGHLSIMRQAEVNMKSEEDKVAFWNAAQNTTVEDTQAIRRLVLNFIRNKL